MPSLSNDLENFALAIVRGNDGPLRIHASYAAYPASVALAAYRNNYHGNLHNALAGAYPVVQRLVGEPFFRRMAQDYIAAHPSQSGNLHEYGENLADFISNFEPAQALAYLPDVAALEWACHRAYFADDADTPNIAELAHVPERQYPELTLRLAPACCLVHSRYPVAAIWHAHQPGMPEDFSVDLGDGPCHALVARKNDVVGVVGMRGDEAAWIGAIQAGMTLDGAMAETLKHHPNFDMRPVLAKLIAHHALAGFGWEVPS